MKLQLVHHLWGGDSTDGFEVSTLTPEFGPYSCMPILPFKNRPTA